MPNRTSSRAPRGPSLRSKRSSGAQPLVRRTLPMRDGRATWAVIADTHGRPHPNVLSQLAAESPDHILHAGDIGDFAVLDELERIAPVLAVRGNIDMPSRSIPDAMILDVLDEDTVRTRVLLVHYGVVGPKLRADVIQLARDRTASLVICGHSHVPFIGEDRGIGIFNPGSAGPRRFGLPIVFGVVRMVRERMRMHHVDCETGKMWQP